MIQIPDYTIVSRILEECGLPFSDITQLHLEHFFALDDKSGLFGVIGLELYSDIALLRSLAVLSKHRGSGFGKQLVGHSEQYAKAQGVQTVYLLTISAEQFFSRQGYSSISRSEAPTSIKNTAEFSNLCPLSSIFMTKRLTS
jgi:amino-acid N-acetyltransferase